MKTLLLLAPLWIAPVIAADGSGSTRGLASWYGEAHRGRLMANGQRFNPQKPTGASWFYPLGTKVRVALKNNPEKCVVVTITDRGPAKRLVRQGRVIDLTQSAFEALAPSDLGLVNVSVERLYGRN